MVPPTPVHSLPSLRMESFDRFTHFSRPRKMGDARPARWALPADSNSCGAACAHETEKVQALKMTFLEYAD